MCKAKEILYELYIKPNAKSLTATIDDFACSNCPYKGDGEVGGCKSDCRLTDKEAFDMWWKHINEQEE